MDSTLAGLIGAAIGALAAIVSAFGASTLQAKQEHRIWLRDRRQEAYASSARYIVRVLNKRSEVSFDGGQLQTVLGRDTQKEWFDDMSEAVIWLSNLSIYCSSSQRTKITEALDLVRKVMPFNGAISPSKLTPPTLAQEKGGGFAAQPFFEAFSSAYEVVLSSQRVDIGN